MRNVKNMRPYVNIRQSGESRFSVGGGGDYRGSPALAHPWPGSVSDRT